METLEESRTTSTIFVQADAVLDPIDPRIYGDRAGIAILRHAMRRRCDVRNHA